MLYFPMFFSFTKPLSFILNELFPEKEFPRRNFPELNKTLSKLFEKNQNQFSGKSKEELRQFFSIPELIKNYPELILAIYSHMIWQIIRSHCFNSEYHADVYQEITYELLSKTFGYIQGNYDDTVSFTPYFSKILINACFKFQTKMAKVDLLHREYDETVQYDFENPVIDEFDLDLYNDLKQILRVYHNERMIFLFKFIYHVTLLKQSIQDAFPLITPWDKNKVWKWIGLYHLRSFTNIVLVFNKYEHKKIKPDSLRRLLDLYLSQIVRELNETYCDRIYDIKLVRDILVEFYMYQARENQGVTSEL